MPSKEERGTERCLQILLGVLSLVAVGLICINMYFGVQLKKAHDELKKGGIICDTRECAEAAGDMIKSMDMETSPCNNFYQFACGNWLKNHPLPDTDQWSPMASLRDSLQMKIREILERGMKDKDPAHLNMAKQFYKSCVAQSTNTTSQDELTDLVQEFLKGRQDQPNPNQLGRKLGELQREMDQSNLGLARIYLVQEEPNEHPRRTAYVELIEEMWGLLYPNVTNRTGVARRIVKFETELAKISTRPEDRRDRTQLYNPMSLNTLSNLTANATMINWNDYIREVFQGLEDELGDINSLIVIVRDLPYFQKFGQVLSKTIEEDEETLWDYLRWRIIYYYAIHVSSELRDILNNYDKKTRGTQYFPGRWQTCSDKANALFGMAISYDYVKDVFASNFQEQMSEMIGNIQEAFYSTLDEIVWFAHPSTRIKAKAKARQMRSFIGYPEWLLDLTGNHSALRKEYKDLPQHILGENHFKNTVGLGQWKNRDWLRHIGLKKDPSKWLHNPTVVNAYYSQQYNSISFAAGILHPPYYFTGKPIQALNYGAIGTVIGHEIIHGFDDMGRQSDGDGNLVDWWDGETVKQYTERAQCFINQYSNYSAEELDHMPLNGNLTLGENIADNGGLRQAFRAYQAFVKENGPERRLPGLPYSPEELFFIAYSQVYCGTYTKQGLESQIKTQSHSPFRFRVNGALQNSVEFAETWGCPLPDEETSCMIW